MSLPETINADLCHRLTRRLLAEAPGRRLEVGADPVLDPDPAKWMELGRQELVDALVQQHQGSIDACASAGNPDVAKEVGACCARRKRRIFDRDGPTASASWRAGDIPERAPSLTTSLDFTAASQAVSSGKLPSISVSCPCRTKTTSPMPCSSRLLSRQYCRHGWWTQRQRRSTRLQQFP